MKKIKFHSIYYRFILFILTFAIFIINMIIADKNAIIQFSNFNLKLWQLNYIFIGIFIAITLIFSFIGWKFYVCKEGIYLRKIDLLVPWEDVDAVSRGPGRPPPGPACAAPRRGRRSRRTRPCAGALP